MENNRRAGPPAALVSSSNTSNSSTYRNPAFQPSSVNGLRSHKVESTVRKRTASRSAFDMQYGGSTPDLSSKSPYYGAHNTNSSNSGFFASSSVPPAGAEVYSNPSYNGELDCDQDSDTGECKTEEEKRRRSLKLAYDLDDELSPRQSAVNYLFPADVTTMPSNNSRVATSLDDTGNVEV